MPTEIAKKRVKTASISIKDVARHANVAWSTASYALNNNGRISNETRQRVIAAAQTLGYSTNSVARTLITGRSHTIGVLALRLDAPFNASQLAGIASVVESRHYQMLVTAHESDPERALAALIDMHSRRLDGILSISTTANINPVVAERLPALGIPFAFSYQEPSDLSQMDCAIADQVHGGLIATEHLLKDGRKRIAFVSGPAERLSTSRRLEGYRQALANCGLPVNEDLLVHVTAHDICDGYAAGQILMDKNIHPDAVFTVSDSLAVGLMRAFKSAGLRVPQDIAVIGFDNTPMAQASEPPLTSVQMPMEELGKLAATRLIDRIEFDGEWVPEAIKLPCSLVIRESA